MDRRDYQASCAVCGGPADPDCPSQCESSRLNIAISQAETQWLEKWAGETREWVANHAIRYVTNTFQAMKEARLANHNAYVKALPYFAIYEQYQGKPPLHPGALMELRRQIYEADAELRRSIDADWRQCVIRYPEVLTHYYSMVNVTMPKDVGPPTNVITSVPTLLSASKPLIERARSTTGTSATKKTRRNSKVSSIKGGDLNIDALTKLLQSSGIAGTSNAMKHSSNNPHANLPTGLPAGLSGGHHNELSSHMSSGLPTGMMSGLHSGLGGLGAHGLPKGHTQSNQPLTGLGGLAELMRTTSKAGRTSPMQNPAPTRPSGKKRHSKDYSQAGRSTAPIPHAPYAPPGESWPSFR